MRRRAFLGTTLAAASMTGRGLADEARLRVAVIGHTGRGNFGHGLDTMWKDVPGVTVVAVADADVKGLAAAQAKLETGRGFTDYRRMLAETKPDIVAIGPRHIDQHHTMSLASIEAGARGIYMEKPFCRTLREADEIVAACARSGAKLALAHRNRYHPVLPVLADLLRQGKIGRVLEYRARGKEDARGGPLDLWVLGCHLFNLIHFFAGEARTCSATVLQEGRPVTAADLSEGAEGVGPLAGNEVHARFEMADGLPAFFDSVQNAGVRDTGFGVQIIGTEGVLDLRVDAEPLAHWRAGSPFRPIASSSAGWIPVTSGGPGVPEPVKDIRKQVGGHLAPALDLIAAIQEGREPLCSAADGRHALEMTAGVFESHRQKGARISLPLKEREHPWMRL
ncbi:MAG TPA: 3-chlorobenzoate-3,4-dioxygenase [Verrucomicrobiales bacterium]|nr:3-chlorobenzoate-3,4-dioxygenase [Verrucomicrobiales bacterium]